MKKISFLLIISILITSFTGNFFIAEAASDVTTSELLVNYLDSPMGIDKAPTFSWKNISSGNNKSQSAYQIIVASTEENATNGVGDMWDSGKVGGNDNYDILYQGEAFCPKTEYFWRVKVWDETDSESEWSSIDTFETGLLGEEDWAEAKWIGAQGLESTFKFDYSGLSWIDTDISDGTKYYRTTVDFAAARELIASAWFMFYGEGDVTAYWNGTEIGSKAASSTTGVAVDIEPYITTSNAQNVLAIKVENEPETSKGVIAKLQMKYIDTTKNADFVTDTNWKVSGSLVDGWNTTYALDTTEWTAPTATAYDSTVDIMSVPKFTTKAAPLIRGWFQTASSDVAKARLYVACGGLYDAWVNGQAVTESVLNPTHTSYKQTMHYNVYDVTDKVYSGQNIVGFELGNGFYNEPNVREWKWKLQAAEPRVRALLEITYADGSVQQVRTFDNNADWTVCVDGPRTFNSIYYGETYDYQRHEMVEKKDGDWRTTAYKGNNNGIFNLFRTADGALRRAAKMTPSVNELKFTNMEPMVKSEAITPKSVVFEGNGWTVIEAPEMMTGWAKINFPSSSRRDTFQITYIEDLRGGYWDEATNYHTLLDVNGNYRVIQQDIVRAQSGAFTYEPKFSYKGFKYIIVKGFWGDLNGKVELYRVNTDVEEAGSFVSANEQMSALHDIQVNTILNNLQGKPTDTPVFEKNGWTGDANVAAENIFYNFNAASFMKKFMADMKDTQKADGQISQIAPSNDWGYDSTADMVWWESAYFTVADELYNYFGDKTVVSEYYDSMKLLMDRFLTTIQNNGWVWIDAQMGDWCSPREAHGGSTAPEGAGIVGTADVYRSLGIMADFADMLGKTADAEAYRSAMTNIYDAFNTKFYKADKGYYETDYWVGVDKANQTKFRQTSQIVPLALGLVPDEYKESVVNALVNDIRAKDTHLDVGIIGTKYILPVLSDNGYSDLAYELINQNTYPSWGYWLEEGATSTWEHYETWSRSYNHYFLGTYDEWLYKHIAGIKNIENGYETFTVEPEIDAATGSAGAQINTVRGLVASNWSVSNGVATENVTVPFGATATIILPKGFEATDTSLEKTETNENATYTVGSGTYSFTGRVELTTEEKFAQCEGYTEGNYIYPVWNKYSSLYNAAKAAMEAGSENAKEAVDALYEYCEILKTINTSNIASGKTVKASSEGGGEWWSASNLTDGELNHYNGVQYRGWTTIDGSASTDANARYNHWVYIDLGANSTFNAIKLYPAGARDDYTEPTKCYGFPELYYVEVSDDASNWTVVGKYNQAEVPTRDAITQVFETVTARYIRVSTEFMRKVPYDGNLYRFQLAEIEVFNQQLPADARIANITGTTESDMEVTFNIKNNCPSKLKFAGAAASYAASGKLVGVDYVDITDTNSLTVDKADNYKVFMWDDMNTLIPINGVYNRY